MSKTFKVKKRCKNKLFPKSDPVPELPSGIKYAKQGQTPWTVLLHIRESRCTGSLIKDKYVITGNNCNKVI